MSARTTMGTFLARLLLALIFIIMGLGKLAAPEPTIQYIQAAGLPAPEAAYWAAVALEVLGGLCLLMGYQTRLAAGALAVFTVVAAAAFHADFGDQNQFTHFMKNLAMAGGLLHVSALGAGRFSIDHKVAAKANAAAG